MILKTSMGELSWREHDSLIDCAHLALNLTGFVKLTYDDHGSVESPFLTSLLGPMARLSTGLNFSMN